MSCNIHKDQLSIQNSKGVEKRHDKEFFVWFKNPIFEKHSKGSPDISEELFALARGPDARVTHYTSYMINGWRFNTRDRDMLVQSQNSGVFVKGDEASGSKDYFGVLTDTKPRDLYDFPPTEEEENDPTLSNKSSSEACQENEHITAALNYTTIDDGDFPTVLSKDGVECEPIEAEPVTHSEDDMFEEEEEEEDSESDGAEYTDTDDESDIQSEEDVDDS
ncbi:hypothetical protein OsJ_23561 [Oryza sativa Japonica Group]|uniref:Uncharacterized protein n=1 Tax=Oryza sativa subsp. japonica TaxID=39947 RepID=B9FW72_ORYSJ|nr:hypothetical protein OsJ_23561 [Oryza sativa Japonica Group]